MSSPDVSSLRKRGFEVLEQIRREYYLPESKLYCEEITAEGKKSGPSFNWGTGVLLSALNAAAKLDAKYKHWLREYADASRVYWNDKGPVPGYDVLPCPKPVDRYYDDNAWMVLALVETYEVLGDKKYLDWAEQALTYVLSGWDEKLGGGIYWRESDKASKNTCSNAPSAVACFRVAKYRRTRELFEQGVKIISWYGGKLTDPADGLLWDSIDLNGTVDKAKWSYNTGLHLQACTMFEDMMVERIGQKCSSGATDKGATTRWFAHQTGALTDEGKFGHLLLEGLARVPDRIKFRPLVTKALAYVYSNVRNPQGRYCNRWDRPYNPSQKTFALIDHASVARAFLFAAAQLKSKP